MQATLHDFIVNHREEILDACRARLVERLPASGQDKFLNQDRFLSEILEGLAALPAEPDEREDEHDGAHRNLGRRRRAELERPELLIHDYGDVCNAIFGVATAHGKDVDSREARMVNAVVDTASAHAVEAYASMDEMAIPAGGELAQIFGALIHDLKNAAASASYGFEILRKGAAPIRGRTADVVTRSLDRIRALSMQALELAHVGALRAQPADHEPLPLGEVVREILGRLFQDRGIQIAVLVPEPATARADRQLLTSAIENLVTNALQFTRAGGTVTVRARVAGGRARIEVEDECGGIDPSKLERIFDPFVQERANRAGTGLGLAIAKHAIEAQGGRLTVENEPGRGCRFVTDLPA